MESWVQSRADGLVPMCFAIFPVVSLKYCACPEKWSQVIQSAAPVTQNHLPKPELMLQNATPLRKSPPWPPDISDEHVSCTALAMRNASFQCPKPAIVFESATKPSRFTHFWQGAQSPAPATENDIWTSKSAPYPSVFSTFDLEMCSAPQRRALFRHVNFQKWSEHGVFCTFWLRNVLRTTTACAFSTSQQKWSEHGVFCAFWLRNVLCATRACTFSTSQLPKVLRHIDLEMCFAPHRRAFFRHLSF